MLQLHTRQNIPKSHKIINRYNARIVSHMEILFCRVFLTDTLFLMKFTSSTSLPDICAICVIFVLFFSHIVAAHFGCGDGLSDEIQHGSFLMMFKAWKLKLKISTVWVYQLISNYGSDIKLNYCIIYISTIIKA